MRRAPADSRACRVRWVRRSTMAAVISGALMAEKRARKTCCSGMRAIHFTVFSITCTSRIMLLMRCKMNEGHSRQQVWDPFSSSTCRGRTTSLAAAEAWCRPCSEHHLKADVFALTIAIQPQDQVGAASGLLLQVLAHMRLPHARQKVD